MTKCKPMVLGVMSIALSVAAPLAGEKLLLKNGGEYLGTPKAPDFVTCHDGRLKIGDGKLRDTSDKCGKSPIGPITGSIREASESEFTINDSHGNEIHFTLTLRERQELGEKVKSGKTVKVSTKNGNRQITIQEN